MKLLLQWLQISPGSSRLIGTMLQILSLMLLVDVVVSASITVNSTLRLVNGKDTCSGRVEVYTDVWETFCDDVLDEADGMVVCIEAGCGPLVALMPAAWFGEGSGPILTTDLQCSGNESSLSQCSTPTNNDTNFYNSTQDYTTQPPDYPQDICDHSQDAGVVCQPILRVRGGANNCSGRVEVFHNRQWGTVCDTNWNLVDADVVCGELGCGNPVAAYGDAFFGPGTGPIWMNNVQCNGSESFLTDCMFGGWGANSCSHSHDAGLTCLEVRLMDGDGPCSGRVEVLYDGLGWGSVCDSGWNRLGADVICSQVNCGSAETVTTGSYFNQGSGQMWTFNPLCEGTESDLKKCLTGTGAPTALQPCTHSNEAGVFCREVMLVNGPNLCAGTLQVRYSGEWATVSQNTWGQLDGIVLCRELGCGPLEQFNSISFPGGNVFPMMNLQCNGSESSLKECSFSNLSVSLLSILPSIVITCGVVRLANGDICSGRVEVLKNGQWGTVCQDGWDMTDATVLCTELNCGSPVEVTTGAIFGAGVGPIWLDNVACTGSEATVMYCYSNTPTANKCLHANDAGAVCREVRLVNQNNQCQGTVEVFHDGQWGTVCQDDWGVTEGIVVCQELGCGGNVEPMLDAYFGPGNGPIWMDSLACTSFETNLRNCPFDGWGTNQCSHVNDAGIICRVIRNVMRIEVTVDPSINPNDPSLTKNLLQIVQDKILKSGNFSVSWRLHPTKLVFQENTFFDP